MSHFSLLTLLWNLKRMGKRSLQAMVPNFSCGSESHGYLLFILYWTEDLQSEKEMAPHSSTLAWKIPWTEEPGGLQSMGSWRVGQDWVTSLSLFTFMHWRRKWQPTPVFLPGESQGRGSLVGCHLWGRAESDTTEATQQQQQKIYNTGSVWGVHLWTLLRYRLL